MNLQRRWLTFIAIASRTARMDAKISSTRMYHMTRKFQRADRHFTEKVFVKVLCLARARSLVTPQTVPHTAQ